MRKSTTTILLVISALAIAGLLSPTIASALGQTNQTMHGSLSAEQERAMSDGVITVAEYESAISRSLECLDNGADVLITEPAVGIDGVRLEYTYRTNSSEAYDTAAALFETCYLQHGFVIDVLYQTSPEVEAAAKANLAKVATCMDRPIPGDGETFTDFAESPKFEICTMDRGLSERPGATFDPGRLSTFVAE